MFMGESNEPEKVQKRIIGEIRRLQKDGISDEDFDVSLKRLYGAAVNAFNDVDDLANNLIDCYFNGYGLFDTLELYKKITKEDVTEAISNFDTENCCLSVIK